EFLALLRRRLGEHGLDAAARPDVRPGAGVRLDDVADQFLVAVEGAEALVGLERLQEAALLLAAAAEQAQVVGVAAQLLVGEFLFGLGVGVGGHVHLAQVLVLVEVLLGGGEVLLEQVGERLVQLGAGLGAGVGGRRVG